MLRAEKDLLKKAGDFKTPAEAIEWMINNDLYNHSRCRAWAMKRYYESLIRKGTPKMDALTFTAEEFCVDDETVRAAVYRIRDL